jgi:hypothetical protein
VPHHVTAAGKQCEAAVIQLPGNSSRLEIVCTVTRHIYMGRALAVKMRKSADGICMYDFVPDRFQIPF